MMQGLAGWQMPDRRARRAADEERPLARRPLGRLRRRRSRCSPGLWRARRDGVGCDCDVSLFETALAGADVRRHVGGHAGLRAAAAAKLGARVDRALPELPCRRRLDRHRRARSRSSGSGSARSLASRSWHPTRASRPWRHGTRTATSCCLSSRRSSPAARCDEWLALLVPAGIPAAKVNTVPEALDDPQTVARGAVVEHEHPTLGTVRTMRHGAARVRRRATACARRPSAASTRRTCCSSCAATPASGSRSWRMRESSATWR